MAYRIRITGLALDDIAESVLFYREQGSEEVAGRWLGGLDGKIRHLEEMPRQFPFAPENDDLDFEIRQTHHFSHRILFTIEESETDETVHILRVYHRARKSLTPADFDLE